MPKADDLAGDIHNSKNIVIPLVVQNRLKMLNTENVTAETKSIKILILSEKGFNAHNDVDVESLRFGACEEVDYGRGCKAIKAKNEGNDLMVEFDGNEDGIIKTNLAGKLIGKTKTGELLIGFSKLQAK